MDGTRAVSGSLDEEDADDITKGFTVTYEVGGGFRLFVTDGFNTEFEFRVMETAEEREFYCKGDSMKIAFVMDGGPKVCEWTTQSQLESRFGRQSFSCQDRNIRVILGTICVVNFQLITC